MDKTIQVNLKLNYIHINHITDIIYTALQYFITYILCILLIFFAFVKGVFSILSLFFLFLFLPDICLGNDRPHEVRYMKSLKLYIRL